MRYKQLTEEMSDLKKRMQELQSAVYAVIQIETGHNLICYMDMETLAMGFTITNTDMVEIKLIQELPAEALILFSEFVSNVRAWEEGMCAEFPYAQYSGENLEIRPIRSEFSALQDEFYDGNEAVLE